MTERDYGAEIDAMRREMREIQALLRRDTLATGSAEAQTAEWAGHVKKEGLASRSNPELSAVLDRLENQCGENGGSGRIAYLGVFASGGRQSTWLTASKDTDELLDLIANSTAEKVLACIGSRDRLNILLSLLKKPMTVAQLVAESGYHSTGQVYHHLKPLIAADLVTEDAQNEGRGYYVVQPHRVQGMIMLLAGISDMLDTRYSHGSWEAASGETNSENA
ncbi:MAG: hypothetical protein DBY36_07455 [Clostridiales bacterium]|nr:MAG: hypothetical protein DBY36_07455 [Clostridiales bacterium]